MADESSDTEQNANEQLEFEFPNPDDFPSYDEVDSKEGEDELPDDSFEFNTADFTTEGCGCGGQS